MSNPRCQVCKARLEKAALRCDRCGRLLPAVSNRRMIWFGLALIAASAAAFVYMAMPDPARVDQHVGMDL